MQVRLRAWYKGKMYYFVEHHSFPDGSSEVNCIGESMEHMFSPDDSLQLLQCTGLVDRNGKEVYEGDIVEYLDNTASGLVRRLVVIEDIRYLPDFQCSQWQEIIGNVYEMVEKLKVNHAQS